MKFLLHIPLDKIAPKREFQTQEAVREMAVALETCGADGCYLTDHPAPMADWLHNDPTGHDALDPFTALAFVAASTTRMKVVSAVVVLPYRNPFLTAKAAATLQVLSGGRFILGAGTGYQAGEFEAMGVSVSKRGALMDEALETIRLAWAGGPVVKRGMNFNAIGNEPRPVPEPPPPIWVGGGSHKAVERAARWGDGWVPFFALHTNDASVKASAVTSMDDLAQKINRIKVIRAASGNIAPFDICVGVPAPLEALTSLEAERFREKVSELAAVGVTWAAGALPSPSRAAFLENAQWFGKEIIAPLSEASQ